MVIFAEIKVPPQPRTIDRIAQSGLQGHTSFLLIAKEQLLLLA